MRRRKRKTEEATPLLSDQRPGGLGRHRENLRLVKACADRGNVEAMVIMGSVYCNGYIVDGTMLVQRDYCLALEYWDRAASRKSAPALRNLAWAARNGVGCPRDPRQAEEYTRQAQALEEKSKDS